MNERNAVGLLLIILFVFIYIYRNAQGSLTENYLDLFVVGFFIVLMFLWQYINPKKDSEEIE